MQVEEESPKQYVDIARAPDKEMRPERPVPSGVAARARGRRSSACAYTRRCDPGAGHSAALERVLAHLRGRIPGRHRGPCSSLRRAVCIVARLDHIDIWPAPCASHTVRPGHNASRAYYIKIGSNHWVLTWTHN